MKITITLELPQGGQACDIQVSNTQKIADTLQVLRDNSIMFKNLKDIKIVREKESGRKISTENTYEQVHIYSGAALILE
ncbi:MAG: hypothetical protein Q4D94_13405 [Bacillota bacterium]|nr:hypothetical protein [Bacillota bacterium]